MDLCNSVVYIGTPYLLSLGLTKSVMSLVWIAGPLSGRMMMMLMDDIHVC